MLEVQTIVPHTLELLKQLMHLPLFSQTRLVGGTALALQYGHRSSVDLDLFGTVQDNRTAIREALSSIGSLVVLSEEKNIKCYVLDGVKLDLVNYPYSWIDEPIIREGVILASPKDIAAMKINAVEGRGTKKDFIDIYFLLRHYTLKEIINFYNDKYPDHSEFRALRSLTYFEDADQQAPPKMFEDVGWETIKEQIKGEVERYK